MWQKEFSKAKLSSTFIRSCLDLLEMQKSIKPCLNMLDKLTIGQGLFKCVNVKKDSEKFDQVWSQIGYCFKNLTQPYWSTLP